MKMNADKSKMKNFELLGVLFSTYSYFHPKTLKKKKKNSRKSTKWEIGKIY